MIFWVHKDELKVFCDKEGNIKDSFRPGEEYLGPFANITTAKQYANNLIDMRIVLAQDAKHDLKFITLKNVEDINERIVG